MSRRELRSADDFLRRYPRLCAHVIAESLGYATPLTAAHILQDAAEGRKNHCEWISSCYRADPASAVRAAIQRRAHHHGYMASYEAALALVRHQLDTGEGPMFASWF